MLNFSDSSERTWNKRFSRIPDTSVRAIGCQSGESRVYVREPTGEGFSLNIRNHQGVLIGSTVQAEFEALDAAGSLARKAVNVFEIAAAAIGWRGKTFALDGEQLFVVLVGDSFYGDGIHRQRADVSIAARTLDWFLKKSNGVEIMTGSPVEMQAKRLIEAEFIFHLCNLGALPPNRKFSLDE